MSRLTTNKPVDEMSMLELAHNSCYAENGNARYRDYEMNMDARDFARNLMITLTGEELPLDDEAFDEEMHDNLQYDQFSSVKGLIALFYRNLWAMADLHETLKGYEDKQEQGLLIELLCGIDDDVYLIPSKAEYKLNLLFGMKKLNRVRHHKVKRITFGIIFGQNGWCLDCETDDEYGTRRFLHPRDYKVTWFLTEAEAEETLAKMGGK